MWRAQISSIFVGTSYVSHSMVVIYTLGVVVAPAPAPAPAPAVAPLDLSTWLGMPLLLRLWERRASSE